MDIICIIWLIHTIAQWLTGMHIQVITSVFSPQTTPISPARARSHCPRSQLVSSKCGRCRWSEPLTSAVIGSPAREWHTADGFEIW